MLLPSQNTNALANNIGYSTYVVIECNLALINAIQAMLKKYLDLFLGSNVFCRKHVMIHRTEKASHSTCIVRIRSGFFWPLKK